MRRSRRRRPDPGSPLKALLFCGICCTICLVIFYVVITLTLDTGDLSAYHQVRAPSDPIILSDINENNAAAIDEEWLPILANASIVHIASFSSGLSPKYRVTFSTGHHAMLKFPEQIAVFRTSRSLNDFNDGPKDKYKELARADRLYQGWPEIAAYHLDRVLGFYRKPPVIGRVITNKQLFTYDNKFITRLRRAIPQHEVEVTMHAWIGGLETTSPPLYVLKYLSMLTPSVERDSSLASALDVSDLLVFDFLVDDHDRKWDFNWKSTSTGTLLHWDSGLAWRHGPIGHESCLDILCGSTFWVNSEVNEEVKDCVRIKRFRKTTIMRIKTLSSDLLPPEQRLSALWEDSLKSDPLFPVFDHGLFWRGSPSSMFRARVRFEPENFYQGLEYRINLLLRYIDDCIDEYGGHAVLL